MTMPGEWENSNHDERKNSQQDKVREETTGKMSHQRWKELHRNLAKLA